MATRTPTPTIEALLNLRSVGIPPVSPFGEPFENPQLSPDGKRVAYVVTEPDWEADRFVGAIWTADTVTGACSPFAGPAEGVGGLRWSPDGEWLAFLRKVETGETRVFMAPSSGGDAVLLSGSDTDVCGFRWSPDSRRLAFSAPAPVSLAMKARKERYGDIEIVGEDRRLHDLWVVDTRSGRIESVFASPEQSVRSYDWSPDGALMALELGADSMAIGRGTEDIWLLDLRDGSSRPLVAQPGPDTNPKWSPDGAWIAFSTTMGIDDYYCCNRRIAVVSVNGGEPVSVTDAFDETAILRAWGPDGVYFEAFQRMALHLFRVDPKTKEVTRLSGPDGFVGSGFTFDEDFSRVAFVAQDSRALPEVFAASVKDFRPRALTDMNAQVAGFEFGSRETIRWRSVDGVEIEGALYKPVGFRPGEKRPLLVIIHGGPTNVSRPVLDLMYYTYPLEEWLARGAVILKPNFRGGSGYGEAFRSLNVRNLGFGDMGDIMSGVDYLIEQGFVDPERMGAMGASWGGYMSAFLATHTDRFTAVSVSAGISDMVTQYANSDIPCHLRRYCEATPWDEPEVYAKASPMTTIRNARTPVLIQHGDLDKRVPIPNAWLLRRGLEDQGAPVRMIVYKGREHFIAARPKSLRAATQHNVEWFDRWIWPDRPETGDPA